MRHYTSGWPLVANHPGQISLSHVRQTHVSQQNVDPFAFKDTKCIFRRLAWIITMPAAAPSPK